MRRAAIFDPMPSMASGGGPMNVSPAVLQADGEVGVLREKPVAGMHRLRAGVSCGSMMIASIDR